MGAAEDVAALLDAVPDDARAAMPARRSQGVDRALEAVRLAARCRDLERLVVVVAANLVDGQGTCSSLAVATGTGSAPFLFPCGPRLPGTTEASMQTTTAGTGADPVATDETDRLIASDKVEGTKVYDRQGERLGSVYNFMVDKRSGKVEYAVLSFGGFLGIGDSYYPLPWKALTYDTGQGG
jgi:sporulation protein YlmC with PRC-barrel domain